MIPAVISHHGCHCPRSPSSKVTQKSRLVLPAILRLVVGPLEPHFWIAMHRYFCVSEDYGKLLKSAGEPSFPTKKNINWRQKVSNFQTIRWLSWTPDIEIEILRVSADQDRFIRKKLCSFTSILISFISLILFAIYSKDWRNGHVTGKPHDLHEWENRKGETNSLDHGMMAPIPIWPWCPFAPSNPLLVTKKTKKNTKT